MLARANTLAYYENREITAVKRSIVQAPEEFIPNKHFQRSNTPFSITTLSISSLSIIDTIVSLSIKDTYLKSLEVSIRCYYSECRIFLL
jgi:hypothetical protein